MHKIVVYKRPRFMYIYSFFERRQILVARPMNKDVRPLPCRRRKSQEYEIVRMWFRRFIKFADSMPNSDVKCLPSCLTKLSVYNIYVDQMKDQKRLSCTQFVYDMWKNNFPNVYIPKVGVIFIKFYGLYGMQLPYVIQLLHD